MKVILVQPSPNDVHFKSADIGAVYHLSIYGLEWPAELRDNPPRVRLLERYRRGPVRCELLDDWPDAPDFFPPGWAPGATPCPGSFWQGPVPDR